jgi:hypothetical protein
MYGYRIGEVPVKIVPLPAPGSFVSPIRDLFDNRAVVAVSMGPILDHASLPHPDPKFPLNLAVGCLARFMSDPIPVVCPEAQLPLRSRRNNLRLLNRFIRRWLKSNLKPLSDQDDVSFDTWIENTPYTLSRKDELRRVWSSMDNPFVEYDPKCKLFMKDEHYTDFKHARGINSRSDGFKCLLGPYSSAMEKALFKLEWFIKKIPINERADYIMDRLYKPGSKYIATDYTSFEALFTPEIMRNVEFLFYEYMLKGTHNGRRILAVMRRTLIGQNTSVNKYFSTRVDAKRQSGEMTTSLGNGFSNLMFMLFVCHVLGSKCIGVVEGDDGLFRVEGVQPTADMFASLGLNIKLELHDTINTASFCGQVFDPDERSLVTDPREVLASFGWTTQFYAKSRDSKLRTLLRAKAYSYLYQYPGCPILASMASNYLRLTAGHDVNSLISKGFRNVYDRELFLNSIKINPKVIITVGPATRDLVEKLFKIPVSLQLRYEDYFNGLKCIESIPLWFETPKNWQTNSDLYVRKTDLHDDYVEFPPELFPKTRIDFPIPLESARYGRIRGLNLGLEQL